MTERPYQQKWLKVPEALTRLFGEAVDLIHQGKPAEAKAKVEQFKAAAHVDHMATQVYKNGQDGLQAAVVFPLIFTHKHNGEVFYSLVVNEDYKGEIFVPEGFEELSDEQRALAQIDTGGPYGKPPLIFQAKIKALIPGDYDRETHILSPEYPTTDEDFMQAGVHASPARTM